MSKINAHFAADLSRLGIRFFELRPAICNTPMTESLSDKSKDYMKTKSSLNEIIEVDVVAEAVISTIKLPLSMTGSIIYCGGIKR